MEANGPEKRFRLDVSGMTCTSCEHHVEQALQRAGATDATADVRRKEVVFSVAGEPDPSSLKKAVESSGYIPGEIEPLPTADNRPSKPVDYHMPIAGMTCADCERHVVDALQKAGAAKADANFRRGEASFTAPASADLRRFEQAVMQAGYQPGQVGSRASEPVQAHATSRRSGNRYDLAIVGSGGGAFAAAITAVERGAKVGMIEPACWAEPASTSGAYLRKPSYGQVSCSGTRGISLSRASAREPSRSTCTHWCARKTSSSPPYVRTSMPT
jgi:mercuric reductase